MDITSPLFLALLANGPVKADGYTYFLYGGKARKCKSSRGPRKKKNFFSIHGCLNPAASEGQ